MSGSFMKTYNYSMRHSSYCHMWRFRVFLMFKHPALAAYTHFVSLDTDLYIVKRMPYNPVTFLANSSAVFATSRLKLDKRRRSDEAHAHPDLPPTKMTAAASCPNWLDDFWASAFDGIPRPFAHDYFTSQALRSLAVLWWVTCSASFGQHCTNKWRPAEMPTLGRICTVSRIYLYGRTWRVPHAHGIRFSACRAECILS